MGDFSHWDVQEIPCLYQETDKMCFFVMFNIIIYKQFMSELATNVQKLNSHMVRPMPVPASSV